MVTDIMLSVAAHLFHFLFKCDFITTKDSNHFCWFVLLSVIGRFSRDLLLHLYSRNYIIRFEKNRIGHQDLGGLPVQVQAYMRFSHFRFEVVDPLQEDKELCSSDAADDVFPFFQNCNRQKSSKLMIRYELMKRYNI